MTMTATLNLTNLMAIADFNKPRKPQCARCGIEDGDHQHDGKDLCTECYRELKKKEFDKQPLKPN